MASRLQSVLTIFQMLLQPLNGFGRDKALMTVVVVDVDFKTAWQHSFALIDPVREGSLIDTDHPGSGGKMKIRRALEHEGSFFVALMQLAWVFLALCHPGIVPGIFNGITKIYLCCFKGLPSLSAGETTGAKPTGVAPVPSVRPQELFGETPIERHDREILKNGADESSNWRNGPDGFFE